MLCLHRALPVESRLLQVAVALEALGYAISEKVSPDQRVPGTYEALLANIFDFLGYEPIAVVGEDGGRDSWCRAFNSAYKGVKHADNDLTDSREAWARAREGLILLRCWFAAALRRSGGTRRSDFVKVGSGSDARIGKPIEYPSQSTVTDRQRPGRLAQGESSRFPI